MSLPRSAAADSTVTVELSGGPIAAHSLTLKQIRACRDMTNDEADVLCIAWGTDTPVDEVRTWLETAAPADTMKLTTAIMEASGLSEGAKFSG